MSTPAPIDYEALARKHGALLPAAGSPAAPAGSAPLVDYEALARKHGGLLTPPGGSLHEPPPSGESQLDALPGMAKEAGMGVVHHAPEIATALTGLLVPQIGIPAALAVAGATAGTASIAQQGIEKAVGDPNAPQSMDEFANRVGDDTLYKGVLPEMAGKAITATIGKIMSRWTDPQKLYKAALRPSGKLEDATRDVATGVREGIAPTEAGLAEATKRIGDLHSEVEGIIARSPADISPSQYLSTIKGNLDKLRKEWGSDAIHGKEFVQQINGFERKFLLNHGNVQPKTIQVTNPATNQPMTVTIQPEDMSLAELRQGAQPIKGMRAQEIKKATYQTIRTKDSGAWDSGTHPGLGIEGEKAMARSLRHDIGELYPKIKTLNPREADLINLEEQLERRIHIEGNKQAVPYFIFPAIGGMLGAAGGAHAGGAAGSGALGAAGAMGGHLLRKALADPAVQARIAILLDRASKTTAGKAAGRLAVNLPANLIRGVEGLADDPQGKELIDRGKDTALGMVGR